MIIKVSPKLEELIIKESDEMAERIYAHMRLLYQSLPDTDCLPVIVTDTIFCRAVALIMMNRCKDISDNQVAALIDSFLHSFSDQLVRGLKKIREQEEEEEEEYDI